MRYNIKHLALGTACVAGLLWFYHTAPTTCLSLALLTPFPIILFFFRRRVGKDRPFNAKAVYTASVLVAASAFYVGFVEGPLTAFLLLGWPPAVTRAILRVDVYHSLTEPSRLVQVYAPILWSPMDQYVIDWRSLGEEEEVVINSQTREAEQNAEPKHSIVHSE